MCIWLLNSESFIVFDKSTCFTMFHKQEKVHARYRFDPLI